ncbi:MAG: Zn-dependent exopeptidase M28 [Clostridiales bacterium]|jgi:hypothetical protein|nr:Zn-dependent exopeptidase M28 [Clostridiales bacterium]
MTELCTKVVREHMVRKGQKRKQAFREMVKAALREKGVFFREERAKGLIPNANLVFGNVRTAEFILGAHYDTCAELPFPNFVAPLNWTASVAFQLLIYAALCAAALVPAGIARLLGAGPVAVSAVFRIAVAALIIWMIAGPANPSTMNDNTSGVAVLLTLLERMTPKQRRRVAVVLFDNEEVGLIGSALFRRKYRKAIREKPMINLDCVGDGRHVLFAASRSYREDEALYGRTRDAFRNEDGFSPLHVRAGSALYPSDQFGFPKSVAVAALHKTKFLGYALGRIHTRRDTVLDEKNIEYLVEGLLKLIGHEDE